MVLNVCFRNCKQFTDVESCDSRSPPRRATTRRLGVPLLGGDSPSHFPSPRRQAGLHFPDSPAGTMARDRVRTNGVEPRRGSAVPRPPLPGLTHQTHGVPTLCFLSLRESSGRRTSSSEGTARALSWYLSGPGQQRPRPSTRAVMEAPTSCTPLGGSPGLLVTSALAGAVVRFQHVAMISAAPVGAPVVNSDHAAAGALSDPFT